MSKTPKQKRASLAAKVERMATATNPKVKPAPLTLSVAETRAVIRALRT